MNISEAIKELIEDNSLIFKAINNNKITNQIKEEDQYYLCVYNWCNAPYLRLLRLYSTDVLIIIPAHYEGFNGRKFSFMDALILDESISWERTTEIDELLSNKSKYIENYWQQQA